MNTKPFFSHKYAVSFSIIIYLVVVFIIDYKTIKTEQMMADENITNRLKLGALEVESVLPRMFHHKDMHTITIPESQHLEQTLALARVAEDFRLRYVYSLILLNHKTFFTSGSALNQTTFANKTSVSPLVKYLENYADAAYIITCPKGACRYFEGDMRAIKRVEQAKNLIESIGLERERIDIVVGSAKDPKSLKDQVSEIIERTVGLSPSPVHSKK